MKINYKKRWDAIRDNLEDRDAFLISLPGNTRYLANSEAPPGCPPGSNPAWPSDDPADPLDWPPSAQQTAGQIDHRQASRPENPTAR